VEILKGPAGTLYGNGSVGGLINANSKRPQAERRRRVTAEYGSFGRKQATVDLTGKVDEEGRVLGRFVGLLRDSDTQVDYGRNDAVALAPSVTFRPTEDTDITILGRYQRNKATPDTQFLPQAGTLDPAPNGGRLSTGTFVGEPGFDRLDTESWALTLDGTHRLNETWSVGGKVRYSESDAHYNHAWWTYGDPPLRYGADGSIDRTVFTRLGKTEVLVGDANATARFSTGALEHKLLLGAGYTDASFDDDDGFGVSPGRIDPFNPVYAGVPAPFPIVDTPAVTFKQKGVYVQDQIRAFERILLTLGARWDSFETDNPGTGVTARDRDITTSVGLMYQFDNGVSPYASYNESFLQENFGTDAAGNAFDPTRGIQYEVGVKYQPPGTPSLFTAALFHIEKSNILVTDPGNPAFQVQAGEASARGLELEAQARLGDFEVEANYAYVDAEDENGAPLDTIAEHQASAWVTYRPDGSWSGFKAGAGVRYVGESFGDGGTVRTPGYTLGDAMVGYETEAWDLTLNVRNVTDEVYVASTGFLTGYYGERRTVLVKLGANF
jgi:iron complex outermembrane receptor protein